MTDCNHDAAPPETLREHMIRAHGCSEAMVRWVLFMRGYGSGILACHLDQRHGGLLMPGDVAVLMEHMAPETRRAFLLGFTDGYRFRPLAEDG